MLTETQAKALIAHLVEERPADYEQAVEEFISEWGVQMGPDHSWSSLDPDTVNRRFAMAATVLAWSSPGPGGEQVIIDYLVHPCVATAFKALVLSCAALPDEVITEILTDHVCEYNEED